VYHVTSSLHIEISITFLLVDM